MPDKKIQPRTFFLNEAHEFTRGEKDGRGRLPKYAPIDWDRRGNQLRASLQATKEAVSSSQDPLRDRRYFMLAAPEKKITKTSTAKKRPPTFDEDIRYAGEHSRVFRRLGVDLLHVDENGTAIVHATPEQVEQLAWTAQHLARAGAREQARWATIHSFAPIPDEYRIDLDWARAARSSVDMVIELQPILTTVEADEVMRVIRRFLDRESDEALVGAGTDFSGRQWFRGRAARKSLLAIAKHLFSVESVHRPISTPVAAAGVRGTGRPAPVVRSRAPMASSPSMPVVAVVDCGIPTGHAVLAQYSRGQLIHPDAEGVLGEHGSLVASRVVFGDLDFSSGVEEPPRGTCRFLDVVVSEDSRHIHTKSVLPAMDMVVANYPDVRVFNLSFGSHLPLDAHSRVERRELLIALRDLDNFVFARDVVVVVAAGNTEQGISPATPYPEHFADSQWALGSWTMGFNTLVCGATVGRAYPSGLARNVNWPSPFTRVGPGICDAPIPNFGAHGGDCTPEYKYATPLGVYVCRPDGTWEDHPGTSFAAPLLARAAAFALQRLQAVCLPGTSPFGVTVKAFLALTAQRPDLPVRVQPLADRTIGRGYASADRLAHPRASSAVVLWQGILENSKDIARIQLPIPYEWLETANAPQLRLLWSWDSPVHDAVTDLWACRRVSVQLKPTAGAPAIRGSQGKHRTYPLMERTYDLSLSRLAEKKAEVVDDVWIVELSYDEIADYYPGIDFSPQQRVALAAELFDADPDPVSPQASIQRLPVAATMVHLGVPKTRIARPVVLKLRR